jgi:integrase
MLPFIAIGAFAGLRAAEIARLDWSAVDLKRKIIHLRADQAKTASRRIIPVRDKLRAWLFPRVGKGGVVSNAKKIAKQAPSTSQKGHSRSRHVFFGKSAELVFMRL